MAEDKDIKTEKEEFVVGGYTYPTRQEADEARNEAEAIRYLSKKADYSDITQVYGLYNRIIDEELFKTQIGMDYLKKLQHHLYTSKSIDNGNIRPIPIRADIQEAVDSRRNEKQAQVRVRMLQRDVRRYKGYFTKSLLVNIFLIIVIIAMIIITATSSSPNILNYEIKLQDRYASWEENLKEREAALREREQLVK